MFESIRETPGGFKDNVCFKSAKNGDLPYVRNYSECKTEKGCSFVTR